MLLNLCKIYWAVNEFNNEKNGNKINGLLMDDYQERLKKSNIDRFFFVKFVNKETWSGKGVLRLPRSPDLRVWTVIVF